MRILTVGNLYPPHHLGGYELVWQAAVRHLRGAGHLVRVLTTDHREPGVTAPDPDPDVHRELRWYWRDHEFPQLSWRERWRLERHNAHTWRRHAAEFKPDAVSWWSMGGMSTSLIRRSRLPATGWVNDDWLVYAPMVDQWARLDPRRVRWDRAARWIFCAEGVRKAALTERGDLGDTAVEPNGVAPDFVEAPDQTWKQRLLYVGRIDERKGIATAIEALPRLPDATLRTVGGGDPRETERLRRLAADLGVGDRVTLDPPVERAELNAVYASGDVTVFPVTWPEPFGLVPLESMAVGRPVVATGQGGSRDYLRDGENCLLFDAGDAGGLATAVERLADEDLRARLRMGGGETARRLTEQRWLSAVLREHERLAGARR